ncbi:9498_t:CDS:2 [Ambispora leptoticha]|uniref:9498_t:CDS:1 n=1 Tax=Ambispora leptoticha TaxID=144679 RepID=A0A9N9BM03_9GLOM|nr:9498_t:CDS:2 [Ambispora leptoticha]
MESSYMNTWRPLGVVEGKRMPARKKTPPPPSSGATSVNTATAINLAAAAAAVSSHHDTTPTIPRQRRRRRTSTSSNKETTPTRKSPRNPSLSRTPVNPENMYSGGGANAGESSNEDNNDDYSSSPKYTTVFLRPRTDLPFHDVGDERKYDFSREEEKFREFQDEDTYRAEKDILKNDIEDHHDDNVYSEYEEGQSSDPDSPSPSVTRIPLKSPHKSREIDTTFPPIPPTSKPHDQNPDGSPFYASISKLLKGGLNFILWPIGKLLNLLGFSVFFLIALIQQTISFVWGNLTGHGQFVRILDTPPSETSPPVLAPSLVAVTSTARSGKRYWWILWIILLLWSLWNVRFGAEDKTAIEYIRELPIRDKLRLWTSKNEDYPKIRIPFSVNNEESERIDLLYIKQLIAEEVRTSCEGKMPTIKPNEITEPHLIQLRGFISTEVKNICASNTAALKNQLAADLHKIKNDVNNDVTGGIKNVKKDVDGNLNTIKNDVKNDINGVKEQVKSQLNDFQSTINGDINHLRSAVKTDINDVRTDIKSEVKNDIKNLRNEIKTDMNELKSDIKNGIKHEYKVDINLVKGELNENMKNMRKDIRNELGHELDVFKHDLSDVQKEFRNEIKEEIKNQVRGDLKSELKAEVKSEISNEVKSQISRTKSLRVPSWRGGEELLEVIRSESRKIVEEELLVFSQDKLNRPDFALHSGGAKIISRFTSKTYELWPEEWYKKLFAKVSGQGILRGKPPVTAISPETHVGHCWPFAGQEGQLAILLNRRVYVTAVTYDHVSRHVTFDVASAPKDFEVWGIIDEGNNAQGTPRTQDPDEETVEDMFKETEDYMESKEEECGFREDGQYVTHKSGKLPTSSSSKPSALSEIDPRIENATSGELKLGSSPLHFFLGSYTYNINGLPVQTFEVPEHIRKGNRPIRAIIMKVNSNWGKPGYTCLYRFRVHGDPVDKIET